MTVAMLLDLFGLRRSAAARAIEMPRAEHGYYDGSRKLLQPLMPYVEDKSRSREATSHADTPQSKLEYYQTSCGTYFMQHAPQYKPHS